MQKTIIKIKRPVNILATKMRKVAKKLLDRRIFLNTVNHNLRDSCFEFQFTDTSWWRHPFNFRGLLFYPDYSNDSARCLFSIFFFDKNGVEVTDTEEEVGLPYLKSKGHFREFVCNQKFFEMNFFFMFPKNAKNFKINISSQNQTDLYLMSFASVAKRRTSEENFSYILSKVEEKISINFQAPFSEWKKMVEDFSVKFGMDKIYLARMIYFNTREKAPYVARYFGKMILDLEPDYDFAQKVVFSYWKSGSIQEKSELMNELSGKKLFDNQLFMSRMKEEISYVKDGFPLPLVEPKPMYKPEKNVLYLLHNSLPYSSGGYATRTHGLIKNITSNSQFTVRGCVRPGYPSDYQKHLSKKLPKKIPNISAIDGIDYLFGYQDFNRNDEDFTTYMHLFAKSVVERAKEFKPAIIHAASNYPNGLAAVQAARLLGVKSVYEVRGLWEITRGSRENYWDKTEQYNLTAKLEAQALQNADASITITKALKDLMVSRGVTKEIHVVPNAVDVEKFKPQEKDKQFAASIGITDEVVIGYVGSVLDYEGLDDLLAACRNLRNRNINFKLLIVGDGGFLEELKKLAIRYDLKKEVIFTGRVPHAEVQKYISLIDIMPFPRKPFLVCEVVSPLKPFESLASKKTVLVSSCAALEEIIKHDETGLVFKKADIDDLTSKLIDLISNVSLRNKLADNGYRWVLENRSWKSVSKKVSDIYEDLYNQLDSNG
jgi:glycosyltransferase involved in cell wall biosynthesis